MAAVLFCERDGVLIAPPASTDDGVHLLPGAAAAVRRLNQAGVAVVVVTDQPAIGRGELAEDRFAAQNAQLIAALAAQGAALAGIHHCPAAGPDRLRKPRPGLVLAAARAHDADLARSWLVGVAADDARAAAQAGCAGAVVVGGAPLPEEDLGIPVAAARDLADAPRVMVPRGGGCWHAH